MVLIVSFKLKLAFWKDSNLRMGSIYGFPEASWKKLHVSKKRRVKIKI